MPTYSYENGGFVINGFDEAPPFCSFLPGLAGMTGIPIWCFYTNRGQGVCSFGIENKDGSIMEFSPANTAYKRVGREGFRTFIKLNGDVYEPFAAGGKPGRTRRMTVRPNMFSIEEQTGDLRFEAEYFIMPGEPFPALVRRCKIDNISGKTLSLGVLDGLPEIIPYGITTGGYKSVSNLNKSWAEVSRLKENTPFYSTRSIPADEAEVEEKNGGYFYLSFISGENLLIRPITDPALIFGHDTGFAAPVFFPETAPETQTFANKYSCGFTPLTRELPAGASVSWNTLAGFAADPDGFTANIGCILTDGYMERKRSEAAEIEEKLTDAVKTRTALPVFDGYIRQSYLDNILRGGMPSEIGGSVIHTFSRKHGDPERDYNFFSIAAEYFSQGNGNFRDVCQNRRCDAFFFPGAAQINVNDFFSLIQADGFNPLEVRGSTFSVRYDKQDLFDGLLRTEPGADMIRKVCAKPFTAGGLVNALYKGKKVSEQEARALLNKILPLCARSVEAAFGEGYWIDHWTYLLDLTDSYLAVFPENLHKLLFTEGACRVFVSPVRVLPRKDAYVLKNGKLRQYKSIVSSADNGGWLKRENGEIYVTTVFAKMICLALNKFASLDPEGAGISMDGGKPGWNDAMNGLPGIFGSGVGESYELLRLFRFILSASGYAQARLSSQLCVLLRELQGIQKLDGFDYWNLASEKKEAYRESVYENSAASEDESVPESVIRAAFTEFEKRLLKGLAKAEQIGREKCGGITPTYLTFEPAGTDEAGFPTGFSCEPLPPFLEGPARQMKTLKSAEDAKDIFNAVRRSAMYDEPLKMYRTSVPLAEKGYEIGRVRAFTPGWLERESVFMHMEFKYLLELLKAGLYDEFFAAMKDAFPPFLDPAVYGRSVMENSSFIASSNNPDPSVVGRGFVSRLSGSTAEVLSMWRLMFWGKKAFCLAPDGELTFEFEPALPGWLFPESGEISFTFLRRTTVTYKNPRRLPTYGPSAAKIKRLTLMKPGAAPEIVDGSVIKGGAAQMARDGLFTDIKVEF